MKIFKGANTKEKLEDASFKVIVASTGLIVLGLLLGSFVKYTVLLAETGAFILLLGIILYAVSQLVK